MERRCWRVLRHRASLVARRDYGPANSKPARGARPSVSVTTQAAIKTRYLMGLAMVPTFPLKLVPGDFADFGIQSSAMISSGTCVAVMPTPQKHCHIPAASCLSSSPLHGGVRGRRPPSRRALRRRSPIQRRSATPTERRDAREGTESADSPHGWTNQPVAGPALLYG